MKKLGSKGFGAIEAVLIFVVVAILSFVGWYVWNQSQKQNETSQPQSSAQVTDSAQESENSDKSGTSLIIEEWGVQIDLTDNIKDANYTIGDEINGFQIAYLSTDTLDKNATEKCKSVNSDGSSFQGIERSLATAKDATGNTSAELATNNPDSYKKIGDYVYWFYHGNAQPCSEENGSKMTDFQNALKTIAATE